MRVPADATLSFSEVYPGWAMEPAMLAAWRTLDAAPHQRQALVTLADEVPRDALAVGVGDRFIACYWAEHGSAGDGSVACIADALRRCRDAIEGRSRA